MVVGRGLISLALASALLAGCASVPPEEAALNELRWEVAKECAGRFAGTHFGRPDYYGRTKIGSPIPGERARVQQCYRETLRARRQSAALSRPVTEDVLDDDTAQSP